jgi:ankyrin repeat protein
LIEEFVISAHGNFPKVREMLEQEPGLLNKKWTKFDENALEASGHMGRADIVEYLLEKGAPPTIFSAAVQGKAEDVAAFLREDPERAKRPGVHGIGILFHVATSGKVEIAEMLVAHGGGEGAGDALHGAIRYGHRDMVAWLLDRGGDPNTPGFDGSTPLTVALGLGHKEIADLLRERGGVESEKK